MKRLILGLFFVALSGPPGLAVPTLSAWTPVLPTLTHRALDPAAFADSTRNYLSKTLESSGFRLSSGALDSWRASRKAHLLASIAALPDSVKASLVAHASRGLSYDWPALPATLYLEYKNNGNRSHFEEKYNERRNILNNLVIAELITGDLKYMPAIANGLWTTLEESTWVLPAHIVLQKKGAGLPDPSEQVIDLDNGMTTAMLGTIWWLLKEQLDSVSPIIGRRIQYELWRRAYQPYLSRQDFWWMGYEGRSVNNWNPWINSNVLTSALLACSNADTANLIMAKVLHSTDFFINGYGEDGGCDEGPTYWGVAGGRLIAILRQVGSVSDGKLDFRGYPLLKRIGDYIYKMHIAGDYFVNFADALPHTVPDPYTVYAFGQYFNDDTLKHFAAYLLGLRKQSLSSTSIDDFVQGVEAYAALHSISPIDPSASVIGSGASSIGSGTSSIGSGTSSIGSGASAFWLSDVQVMVARSGDFFVAAQGGNNGESHNHNDVGNFIVYKNGLPMLVDAGVGTYTAKTFSAERYTLWNMQSEWHNCPLINGVAQKDGVKFRATALLFGSSPTVDLSMDIAAAYPPAASVESWQRSWFLTKTGLTLTDDYSINAWKDSTRLNFLTPCTVLISHPGIIAFVYPEPGATSGGSSSDSGNAGSASADAVSSAASLLTLTYDPSLLYPVISEKEMDDARLQSSWGQKLYRVSLVVNNKNLHQTIKIQFR